MTNYEKLREEYISLVKRSIRQKVFADEDTLGTSPDTINSALQKYNTDAVKIELIKPSGQYGLKVEFTFPWKTEVIEQIGAIDVANPSLSLFLNLKDFLREIVQKELETTTTKDLKGDFEDYFDTLEYRLKFLKEETNKILNSIPDMKKEIIFQLFLLKKENEYFSKWKEMKANRLKRIFELQEQLEEAWLTENKIKDGEKVFIREVGKPRPTKGLVWKVGEYGYVNISDITKPYVGKIGYLENHELYDMEGHRCFNFSERSLFVNDEYTLNILPPLLKEMKAS